MNEYRESKGYVFTWMSKNQMEMEEHHMSIISCFVASIIGILTIIYTAWRWRRNIKFNWMKAIARSKKNPKSMNKVPQVPHSWSMESVTRGRNLSCCVCLESISPSQTLGPMVASDSYIHHCSICGAAAHLNCSAGAQKDCKFVSMFGCGQVLHQWAVKETDRPDESSLCSYCEEPYTGSFLEGTPIWCQRLMHIDCPSSMINISGDGYETFADMRVMEAIRVICPVKVLQMVLMKVLEWKTAIALKGINYKMEKQTRWKKYPASREAHQ